MADKSVGELIAAQSVTPTDLFVLEQNGTAKKLTGQVLENWLVSFADGHGGIQSIAKLSTSGLVDTYRITLADTTTFDFAVTNGKGITSISKTSTSGLADTYTISYNDGTSGTFTVKNGDKGDKGDNAYIWIKYASQEPTEASHSMGDLPDDWIGIYSGKASTAPTDWQQYKWFKIKGKKGDTGSPATLVTKSVTYQVSDSGTIIPSGSWGSSIPVVSQGKYLWTKTELQFNTGDPIVSYSVARMGIDGSGAVSSVAGVSPDETGNVALTAADVGALPVSGGDMTGAINMNGQPISGLNDPTEDNHAARKSYVDKMLPKTGGTMSGSIAMGGNRITGLGTPTANTDAATKGYADAAAGSSALSLEEIEASDDLSGKIPNAAAAEKISKMAKIHHKIVTKEYSPSGNTTTDISFSRDELAIPYDCSVLWAMCTSTGWSGIVPQGYSIEKDFVSVTVYNIGPSRNGITLIIHILYADASAVIYD